MDSDDELPSRQLQQELEAASAGFFDARSKRPVLLHLNADSSWLLSIPYPKNVRPPSGRCRFNIVIDAWLRGPQVDVFGWFSTQEHANASRFQSLEELSDVLRAAELAALGSASDNDKNRYYIDAIFCSHEFTDHCHEATLREVPQNVPVFATKKAAALVESWKHFKEVIKIPVFSEGFHWRQNGVSTVLPDWIGLGRIHTKGDAPIYFHSALAITFALDKVSSPETVIYTPHGVAADSLSIVRNASPSVSVLALLHGLHDVSLVGARLNMGMDNAVRAREVLQAKYWLPTHDEVKRAYGLVASFLKRIEHTIPLAPGSHPITPDKQDLKVTELGFIDLKNGQSYILT